MEVGALAWETTHKWRQEVCHQSITSEGKQSATGQTPVKTSSQSSVNHQWGQAVSHQPPVKASSQPSVNHQWRQAVSHQSPVKASSQPSVNHKWRQAAATSQTPVIASSQLLVNHQWRQAVSHQSNTREGKLVKQSATNHQSRYQKHCVVEPNRPIRSSNSVQYVTAAKLIATDILEVGRTRRQVGNVEGGTIHACTVCVASLQQAFCDCRLHQLCCPARPDNEPTFWSLTLLTHSFQLREHVYITWNW